MTIIAASVDSIKDMKLVSEGKRFPNREKEIKFHICYGVNKGLAKKLGEEWNIELDNLQARAPASAEAAPWSST